MLVSAIRSAFSLGLGSALLSTHGPTVINAQLSTQVVLGNTTITGIATNLGNIGIESFGGIPFAEPPLGALRFYPPVLVGSIPWSTFDATQFGAPCAQLNVTDSSEDCLTLNIFRPAGANATSSLPVMVWIYGGGFQEGETSVYNASGIIAQSVERGTPVLYVSLNYRLGPFGFPQGHEAAQRGALNLGLKDQLAGLQWVQNNIAAFGGNAHKITIFGQSAGSMSISDLYLNSGLENLVRGAIFESGSTGTIPFFNASERQPAWDSFISNLTGCADTLAAGASIPCAQNATTEELLSAWRKTFVKYSAFPFNFLFVPVIDGPGGVVPDLPSRLIEAGKFAKIPFIAGANLDEGTTFTPNLNTTAELVQFLTVEQDPFSTSPSPAFQNDIDTLLALYPAAPALGSPFGTGNATFGLGAEYKRGAAIFGDMTFQAPRRKWTAAASAAGVRAYGYLFADENAVEDPSKGVTHALEVPYVYGATQKTSSNAGSRLLSEAMLDYWLSFVVSQTPNDGKGVSRTEWPEYRAGQNVLKFDTTALQNASFVNLTVIPDTYRSKQISFINSVSADLNQ